MNGNSVTFSPVAGAREKVLLLGPPGVLFHRIVHSVRSLQQSEYVSFDQLTAPERDVGQTETERLAAVRHWYWSRKRDQGFVLASFPLTLGHALVFDEWMDARDETLSRCWWIDQGHAEAAAEAARCYVCPQDGMISYAESLGVAPFCEVCGTRMESCARTALTHVDRWWQLAGRNAAEIARHYEGLGLLHRVDVSTLAPSELASA